jgi:threonine/homoserine/homoserine lactone efflux protein
MHDIALLAAFWAAFLLALVSPGPNFALIASTALRFGRRRALGIVAGLIAGEAVWACTAVFGVSALASQHPAIAEALRIGGGALLLLIGLGAIRAAWRPSAQADLAAVEAPKGAPAGIGFWRGLGLMLLNPKAGVFWVSLSGLFLGNGTSAIISGIAVSGAVTMSAAWHGGLAWALSADAVAPLLKRGKRALEAVFGVVLTAIGLKIIAS